MQSDIAQVAVHKRSCFITVNGGFLEGKFGLQSSAKDSWFKICMNTIGSSDAFLHVIDPNSNSNSNSLLYQQPPTSRGGVIQVIIGTGNGLSPVRHSTQVTDDLYYCTLKNKVQRSMEKLWTCSFQKMHLKMWCCLGFIVLKVQNNYGWCDTEKV